MIKERSYFVVYLRLASNSMDVAKDELTSLLYLPCCVYVGRQFEPGNFMQTR